MTLATAYIYVLTALGRKSGHGLGIAEDVAAFTEGETILGPGTLYRCLADLADEGLIQRTAPPPGEDNPHRKYYRITEAGRERLVADARALDRVVRTARARLRVLEVDPLEAT